MLSKQQQGAQGKSGLQNGSRQHVVHPLPGLRELQGRGQRRQPESAQRDSRTGQQRTNMYLQQSREHGISQRDPDQPLQHAARSTPVEFAKRQQPQPAQQPGREHEGDQCGTQRTRRTDKHRRQPEMHTDNTRLDAECGNQQYEYQALLVST